MKRLSARQQEEYDNATRCYICRHEFIEGKAKGHKVRDHDHITGWFISAAHRQCNLVRPVSFKIPVFLHNFRGYNAHLIVYEFGKRPDREIKVFSKIMEKYLQVEWWKTWSSVIRFNSCLLLWSSLRPREQKLAASITKISTTWLQMFISRRTLRCLSVIESFATTTSTLSRGSMGPHYSQERVSSTTLEALSAHWQITRTPST